MLPPLMPKPLKMRHKMQPLPVRREPQTMQPVGDLRAPLRVLGNARTDRTKLSTRPATDEGGA